MTNLQPKKEVTKKWFSGIYGVSVGFSCNLPKCSNDNGNNIPKSTKKRKLYQKTIQKKNVQFWTESNKTKCGIPTPLVETKLGSHKSLEPIIRCTKVIICIWSRVDLIYGSDMCATLKKIKSGAKMLVMPMLFFILSFILFLAPNWPGSMKRKSLC